MQLPVEEEDVDAFLPFPLQLSLVLVLVEEQVIQVEAPGTRTS